MQVACSDDGLEAIVFTAQGDMRQVRHCFMGQSSRLVSIARVKLDTERQPGMPALVRFSC